MTNVAAPLPLAISRPLDAPRAAYALNDARRDGAAVPVSGALVRSVLRSALHSHGAAAVEPDGTVVFSFGPTASMLPAVLGPVYRAVPCEWPPRTPCCALCGHWEREHDEPGAPTACTRYRLSIGPARFAVPEHEGVTYAWTRRLGRTRVRFEITEPTGAFPGGTLMVRRMPAPGDGPYEYAKHFLPIPRDRRTAVLERARRRVHPQPCPA
ncbi:hypothetical protein ACIQ9R_36155 [Streptomyces sp. NPDC094447]|uniref:hypothetical protein n=1 Tax=Streptomyces sp. NPDC094447 TaxID=3366062 RepID=UPI00382EDB47